MANEFIEYKGENLARNDSNETIRLKADSTTNSLKIIPSDQSTIHNKKGYSFSASFTGVVNGSTVALAYKTPTAASGKVVHLVHKNVHAASDLIRVDFYEGLAANPTFGSDLPIFNHNRTGSIPASAMQDVKFGIDVVLGGATMIETCHFTNYITQDIEWILKPDTWYVRTFSNFSGALTDIDVSEFWIEE